MSKKNAKKGSVARGKGRSGQRKSDGSVSFTPLKQLMQQLSKDMDAALEVRKTGPAELLVAEIKTAFGILLRKIPCQGGNLTVRFDEINGDR